jgi:superfamily II DNA or RNA helicase
MRSDNKTLFGVPFETREDGDQYYVSLHEVTMRDAHAEGKILKRVQAHVVDYKLKMVNAETNEMVEMSLSKLAEIAKKKNDVDAFLARKKLRFHEVYLDSLLRPAFETFAAKRADLLREAGEAGVKIGRTFRNHQMLIIAMSNRHAEAILLFVQRHFSQFSSARIGQDVAQFEREQLLGQYRAGKIDVMVQVDMIGEGTDIKPISIIIKADLVRAYSKTLQQIFRGMRYFDNFSEKANLCDIYAANDSEVVGTLEWITSEEQLGVKLKEDREREEALMRNAPEESGWQLMDVQHRDIQTHALELFPEYARPLPPQKHASPAVSAATVTDYIVDISRREHELRQECAALASKLAYILRSQGRPIEVSAIHSEAKRRFSKAQDELSINELTKKQRWLEMCVAKKKLM